MPVIYHVTSLAEWSTAREKGVYEASSLSTEGFIHCSEASQVPGVLQRYFSGKTGLVKLVIDTEKLSSKWVKEWSASTQEDFPHIYGPINLDAVVDAVSI